MATDPGGRICPTHGRAVLASYIEQPGFPTANEGGTHTMLCYAMAIARQKANRS